MRFPSRILLLFVAFVMAACSSGAEETTTSFDPITTVPPAEETTTAPPPDETTTTTTLAPEEIPATINGLPADEPELLERRVVAVKIDNHLNARPQSGLEVADAVYEVLVEGGITRLIALFHQSDTEYVGPNRSGRPTDGELVLPLGAPFQISGAQPWVRSTLGQMGLYMIYDNGTTTYRMRHRRAPHNLYSSTLLIREWADDQGWPDDPPPPLFVFGLEPTPLEGEAAEITLTYSGGFTAVWEWDGETYLRTSQGRPHLWVDAEGEEGQVSFDTLVVMKARRYTASGGSGSSVPAQETTGSGEAYVFRSGGVLEGTWEREEATDMIRYYDADGEEIVLPPGRVWISVFPTDQEVVWE